MSEEVIILMLDNQNLILNNCLDEKKDSYETNKMNKIIRKALMLIVLKYILTISFFIFMVLKMLNAIKNSSDQIYTLSSTLITVSSVILSVVVISSTFIIYKIGNIILSHMLVKYDKELEVLTEKALLYGNNVGLFTDMNNSKMAIIAVGHDYVKVLLREYGGTKRFYVPVCLFLEKGSKDEMTFYNDHIDLVLTDALYNEIEILNDDSTIQKLENSDSKSLLDIENGIRNSITGFLYDSYEEDEFEDDEDFYDDEFGEL